MNKRLLKVALWAFVIAALICVFKAHDTSSVEPEQESCWADIPVTDMDFYELARRQQR